MANQDTTFHGKVPMGQKIAFGLGMLANQMFPAALGIFMVILVQNLGFPGWMWGFVYLFPRFFDAISDPIMGFISDNTRSVWGRRRQYVFLGAIIMGISFVAMWQLYRDHSFLTNYTDYLSYINVFLSSDKLILYGNFIYFLLWSFAFYLGLTIFSVPYVAMGYEMTDDFHERTNIMATAQWIGQWAWVIAPWFWVIMYDPKWFPDADTATRTLAVYVGIICAILAMIPAIFIKSRSTKNETSYAPLTLKNMGGSLREIFSGFKDAFSYKEFRKLCFSTFLIYNAFNTVAAFSFFIVVYYLFNADAGAAGVWPTLFGSVGALVTTFIVIPIVAWLSKKFGKKNAFIISQSISIFGYLLFWFLFIPGKPYMFLIALPFFSFGIGSLFTIMMSMTGDICDLDELHTGKRREGIFGAIYWWMVKVGFAIAGGLSGFIMSLVGFDANLGAAQPDGAIDGLRLFFSGLPILGTLGAIWIMRNYDLTEKRALEIRAEIDAKKQPKSSSYYQLEKLLSLPLANLNIDKNDIDFTGKTEEDIKRIFRETLNNGMYGICFSPYTEGQNIGTVLTREQIERRMKIVAPHTQWVRSFSCTEGNELIPNVAKAQGLKTMVGAWIDDDLTKNELEIKNLIQQAQDGNVDIAIIGNEVLLREDLSLNEILSYINRVKQALPDVKVGYVDAYYQFYENPELVEACDVIAINCYPFWEGSSIESSADYLKKMYAITESIAQGKQVIITETGWANQGEQTGDAIPTDVNAMKYFINAVQWQQKNKIPLFYFSSFDESWKIHHEGDVGARWGLWDKNEKLKY